MGRPHHSWIATNPGASTRPAFAQIAPGFAPSDRAEADQGDDCDRFAGFGALVAADARDLVASVYAGFAEGFDTLDLRQAKALLDKPGP